MRGMRVKYKPWPASLVVYDQRSHTKFKVICKHVTTDMTETGRWMRFRRLVHPVALVNRLVGRTEVNPRRRRMQWSLFQLYDHLEERNMVT